MGSLVSIDFLKEVFPDFSEAKRQALADRAQALIAEYTGTVFTVTSYTETHDSTSILRTDVMPIQSVTSITDLTSDELLAAQTDYFVYSDHIFLPSRTFNRQDLSVVYTAGTTQIPTEFVIVAEDLLRFWGFKGYQGNETFYVKESMSDRSYEPKDQSEKRILSRLERYPTRRNAEKGPRIRIGVI